MATHSSILAWKIPWTQEPGGLQSIGSEGAGHRRATEHMQKRHMQKSGDERELRLGPNTQAF